MLDAELWKASEVGAEYQCLVDESIRTGRLINVPASGLSAGGEALMVEGVPYVVVGSVLFIWFSVCYHIFSSFETSALHWFS